MKKIFNVKQHKTLNVKNLYFEKLHEFWQCYSGLFFVAFILNTIISCIHKHPKLATDEFNNHVLSPMLEKVSFENKEVYLMGDFNINLLNYELN